MLTLTRCFPARISVPFRRWWRNLTTRHDLRHLSDAQLRDLGLTRAAVMQEAARPFWDS